MSTKKRRQVSPKVSARKSGGARNKSLEVFIKRDFLTKRELRGLTRYVLKHESDFTESTVVPDGVPEGANDPSYRRSRVLFELEEYGTLIQDRLLALLPDVLRTFNREAFPISHIDVQITASNDGDFFKVHQDNSFVEPLDVSLRELSFVHYFNSEPRAFSGGQLRFYELEDGEVQSSVETATRTITPRQNTLVFFPSSHNHEVLPVRCPTRKFRHSRFTVNGWFIRDAAASNEANPPAYEDTTAFADGSPDMGWLVDAVRALGVPRSPIPGLYLTLDEASAFSGLSFEYLERLIQEQKVTAIDDDGWKIRRRDLENL
jgi:Rps23 Pro-64 3,4-dihydroxylase Tpa1-like proline 4-hydroxylase